MIDAVISSGYVQGKLSVDWVAIDSTYVAAKKEGEVIVIGYDGNKHILGSKIHGVVSGDSALPINVIFGPANDYDSSKLFSLE